jgi:hypothetical protein
LVADLSKEYLQKGLIALGKYKAAGCKMKLLPMFRTIFAVYSNKGRTTKEFVAECSVTRC